MKLLLTFFGLIVIMSCSKTQLPPINERESMAVNGKPSYTLYVHYMQGIVPGGCLIWSYSNRGGKRNPDDWGYCSMVATTDVAKIHIYDWATQTPLQNVTVKGNWSGAYTITGASAKTNADGIALVAGYSGYSGSATFQVTAVSLSGSSYDPAKNVQTSVTIR